MRKIGVVLFLWLLVSSAAWSATQVFPPVQTAFPANPSASIVTNLTVDSPLAGFDIVCSNGLQHFCYKFTYLVSLQDNLLLPNTNLFEFDVSSCSNFFAALAPTKAQQPIPGSGGDPSSFSVPVWSAQQTSISFAGTSGIQFGEQWKFCIYSNNAPAAGNVSFQGVTQKANLAIVSEIVTVAEITPCGASCLSPVHPPSPPKVPAVAGCSHTANVAQVFPSTSVMLSGYPQGCFVGGVTIPQNSQCVPGILCLQTAADRLLDVNAFISAACCANNVSLQSVVLTKEIPGSLKVPNCYPHLIYNQIGRANIRTWWPLEFSMPGTTFKLSLTGVCGGNPGTPGNSGIPCPGTGQNPGSPPASQDFPVCTGSFSLPRALPDPNKINVKLSVSAPAGGFTVSVNGTPTAYCFKYTYTVQILESAGICPHDWIDALKIPSCGNSFLALQPTQVNDGNPANDGDPTKWFVNSFVSGIDSIIFQTGDGITNGIRDGSTFVFCLYTNASPIPGQIIASGKDQNCPNCFCSTISRISCETPCGPPCSGSPGSPPCIPIPGTPGIPGSVGSQYSETWLWTVVANPQSFLILLDCLHDSAMGNTEISCFTDESVFAQMKVCGNLIATAIDAYKASPTSSNKLAAIDAIQLCESLIFSQTLFVDSLVEAGSVISFPNGNFAPVGAGIVDSVEGPCSCKMITDLEFIFNQNGLNL